MKLKNFLIDAFFILLFLAALGLSIYYALTNFNQPFIGAAELLTGNS